MFEQSAPDRDGDGDVWAGWDDRCEPCGADAPPGHGWLFGTVAQRLAWVLERRPDSQTFHALEVLGSEPMSAAERVLFAQACERQAAAAAGLALAAIGAAAPAPPAGDEPDLMAVELGAALRMSDRAAAGRVHLARRMRDVLPALFARWRAGEVSWAHVRALDELTTGLPDELASTIDAAVAPRAVVMTAAGFRRVVRREVARRDHRAADDAHEQARRDRRVVLEPAPDGMAWLHLLLTATEAVAAMQAINAGADAARRADDGRRHGERQADVALTRLLGGDGAATPRWRCEIQAVIDLPSLLGLRDRPGELVGYGPVSAGQVRDLLARDGTTLRRLVTDPVTGLLVDYGRTRYRPDALLIGLVQTRDRTCRFPGCEAPAVRCDVDHRIPYHRGGRTATTNCHLLCRRHHRIKTHFGYRYEYDPTTGVIEWITPLGFRYRKHPPPYTDPDPPQEPPESQ